MAEKTVQVVILQPRGNPLKGGILARGAKVTLPEAWAERFVADGTAELVEEKRSTAKPKADENPPVEKPVKKPASHAKKKK